MARKALLIGTSQYSDGFKPLESTLHDINTLSDLLENSDIGGFDDVQVKLNETSSDLATAIEEWYISHAIDDFVLLFIAGHGVKDYDRKLHFATVNTKKSGERLKITTAIAATSISNFMRESKAKRQIVILNCCFSGAFGDLVPMDGGTIDLEESIAAEDLMVEGRVVLTSTSSMNYAFERSPGNGDLSVYGHYLVEGLRTGAGAAGDGITIARLHEYVSRKVKEEAPSMTPKIFAKDEGYNLRIANVALSGPEVEYRRAVEPIVVEDDGEIDEILSRPLLEDLRLRLKLDKNITDKIESEVLAPIRDYRLKCQKYRELYNKSAQENYPLGERQHKRLQEIQGVWGISQDDASRVAEDFDKNMSFQDNSQYTSEKMLDSLDLQQVTPSEKETNPIDLIQLISAKGVNYKHLRKLLKSKKWKEADRETDRIIFELIGKESSGFCIADDVKEIPHEDLLTIDRLWTTASRNHFGFSIQKKIWEECGSPDPHTKNWDRFCNRIGWKSKKWWGFSGDYLASSDLSHDLSLSPEGELPWYGSFQDTYLFFRHDL
jgi:hypothetical protein